MHLYPDSSSSLTRRELLRRSGMGFAMLGLAGVMQDAGRVVAAPAETGDAADGYRNPLAAKQPHFPVKAKRVIHIFCNGGPSHVDTFDPKPDAAAEIRGPFAPISTTGGFQITEILPQHAKVADKFSVVRSCYHTAAAVHDTGHQMLQTGRLFTGGVNTPHIGCALSYLRGRKSDLPPHVILPEAMGPTGGNLPHGQDAADPSPTQKTSPTSGASAMLCANSEVAPVGSSVAVAVTDQPAGAVVARTTSKLAAPAASVVTPAAPRKSCPSP